MGTSLAFGVLLSVFTVISLNIALIINMVVEEPYMDEIFHIPQTQSYCKGNYFEWNPKITTLPGLYIFARLFVSLVSLVSAQDQCNTFTLRSSNILFALGNLWVMWKIISKINPFAKVEASLLYSFTLSFLPTLFFFNFLFYTDVGSTFTVLLAYYLSLRNNFTLSAIVSVISVVFRQTNIIWVVFIAATSLVTMYQSRATHKNNIFYFIWFCITNLGLVIKLMWGYILVGVAFIVFLVKNEGIVVGDQTHHQMHAHISQIFYFFAFALFFLSIPSTFDMRFPSKFLRSIFNSAAFTISLIIASAVIGFLVQNFSITHPFILADNRHYIFYIWKNYFRRYENADIYLIPIYVYSICLCWNVLARNSYLWRVFYFACVSLVLIPTPLVEFRYFIIPYLLLRLNSPIPSKFSMTLELALEIAINLGTLYLFLYRPFVAPDGSVGRFMW